MRPGLVIFDCDGVIVDSEPLTARAISSNLTRHGWRVEPDEVDSLFTGGTIYDVRDKAVAQGAALSENWVDQMYQELFEALVGTPPIDGVGAVLDRLDAISVPYCIGSNGPHAKMDVTLASAGFAERFAGRRFSARDVANPKPAPDLFLHAAAQMGFAPEQCVVVGDTRADAKGAKAAGMRCFGYAAHTPAEQLTEHGATAFFAMSELPALLQL